MDCEGTGKLAGSSRSTPHEHFKTVGAIAQKSLTSASLLTRYVKECNVDSIVHLAADSKPVMRRK